jgi:ABC-type sulfate/molybdate transport systems ATPase subunit
MLMVTHDVREALLMSDKVAYVANGRIQQEGPSADVLMQAATLQVAASFGSALAVEGRTEKGVFTSGKLVVPASHVPDGPAVLLRTADGAITVHPRI